MKKCNKCQLEKDFLEFNSLKKSKDGLRYQCKQCEKDYRVKNKDNMKEYLRKYYEDNKDDISIKNKDRYENNKENYNENRRRKYNDSEELRRKKSLKAKEYRLKNKEKVSESKKKYYEKNKEYISNWKKEYYESIKESPEYKDIRNKNMHNWSKKNPHIVAWRNSLRRVIYQFNIKKTQKTIDILGYSADDFKNNIESKFLEGMTWENWREWHIDHIIPVSKFDKDTHPSVVNALSNLQPLWSVDNYKKSNN